MHPFELMHKYGLSYAEMSRYFGISEQAVRRWFFSGDAKGKTTPPPMAYCLAELLDFKLSAEKKLVRDALDPPKVGGLFFDCKFDEQINFVHSANKCQR